MLCETKPLVQIVLAAIFWISRQIIFQVAPPSPTLFAFAPHAGAGHFFSLLRQRKKAKKGDCGHRFGFAKLPSLRTIFRAGSQLAAAPLRACKPLFPKKPRSVRLCQQGALHCTFVVNFLF
ncbi:hypothetical protein A7P98_07265 [Eikenella sp. NML080894]|nr:hypothetical protein A7P98_07265 [Eikenella sp. NML080894]OAM37905.1 hypothetical protein A7P99_05900 [Eikenella sp. NML120348]